MAGEYWLGEEAWAAIDPLLPKVYAGARRQDDRRIIGGIVHVLRSGWRWIDCPAVYGPYTTVYNRSNRWNHRGRWQAIFEALLHHDSKRVLASVLWRIEPALVGGSRIVWSAAEFQTIAASLHSIGAFDVPLAYAREANAAGCGGSAGPLVSDCGAGQGRSGSTLFLPHFIGAPANGVLAPAPPPALHIRLQAPLWLRSPAGHQRLQPAVDIAPLPSAIREGTSSHTSISPPARAPHG
jgi:transposase